jgi:hypothetical protein
MNKPVRITRSDGWKDAQKENAQFDSEHCSETLPRSIVLRLRKEAIGSAL